MGAVFGLFFDSAEQNPVPLGSRLPQWLQDRWPRSGNGHDLFMLSNRLFHEVTYASWDMPSHLDLPHTPQYLLAKAICNDDVEGVDELLNKHPISLEEPSFEDKDKTPLGLAACLNRTNIIELLVARGADPNYRNKLGQTPLMSAVEGDNKDAIQTLVELGARPEIEDEYGYTPQDIAERNGLAEVAGYLQAVTKSEDPNWKNQQLRVPYLMFDNPVGKRNYAKLAPRRITKLSPATVFEKPAWIFRKDNGQLIYSFGNMDIFRSDLQYKANP